MGKSASGVLEVGESGVEWGAAEEVMSLRRAFRR